jgi:RNA polymerase subunit RPABC4/transcription elongation factor Spt4
MQVRNETPTRFADEIRIISPIAYFIAFLAFVGMQILVVIVMAHDPKAPPIWGRIGIALLAGAVTVVWVLLVGYVNRDSGRRGMGPVLWTLVAIFVPNALGIVLYFILRKPRLGFCPQCGTHVEAGFGFCPKCRYRLQPVCPHCQRGVQPGDLFCPYCGGALNTTTTAAAPLVQP